MHAQTDALNYLNIFINKIFFLLFCILSHVIFTSFVYNDGVGCTGLWPHTKLIGAVAEPSPPAVTQYLLWLLTDSHRCWVRRTLAGEELVTNQESIWVYCDQWEASVHRQGEDGLFSLCYCCQLLSELQTGNIFFIVFNMISDPLQINYIFSAGWKEWLQCYSPVIFLTLITFSWKRLNFILLLWMSTWLNLDILLFSLTVYYFKVYLCLATRRELGMRKQIPT